jgi:hypothetical protein
MLGFCNRPLADVGGDYLTPATGAFDARGFLRQQKQQRVKRRLVALVTEHTCLLNIC